MIFENFQEVIFAGIRCTNFCRGKNEGQVSFYTTKKSFVQTFQKLTEKNAKVDPHPKT